MYTPNKRLASPSPLWVLLLVSLFSLMTLEFLHEPESARSSLEPASPSDSQLHYQPSSPMA